MPDNAKFCPECGEISVKSSSGQPKMMPQRFSQNSPSSPWVCPQCNGPMTLQTVAEREEAGCLTVLLYIILAITILGILVLIPVLLSNHTVTRTYAVCNHCGYRLLVSE